MSARLRIEIPEAALVEFCRRNHIARLAFFGSVIRDDFRPDSDVDVLVEFETGHVPGLRFFGMQDELSQLLGRKVDLNTPGFLSTYFRDAVLHEAENAYVAAQWRRDALRAHASLREVQHTWARRPCHECQ